MGCFQRVYPPALGTQMVKNLPAIWDTWIRSLSQKNPLEKGIATHFSVLVWRISWTEEPDRHSLWGCKESYVTEWLTLPLRVKLLSIETNTRRKNTQNIEWLTRIVRLWVIITFLFMFPCRFQFFFNKHVQFYKHLFF